MGWSEKYKKSIDCDNPKGFSQRAHCQGRKKKMNEAKEKDHEVSMAKTQVKKSIDNLQKVARVLAKKTDADNLPAWVQAKLTDTEHNTSAAADYMQEGKRDGKSAKDKDYSLRDWFSGGGWVQAGGKYDGKPCAKQPGQKTKPFCRDADDRAAMSKDEREKRAKKKRKEDPNPNRKGKAKIVTAEAYDTSGTKYKGNPEEALRDAIKRQKLGGEVEPRLSKSANLEKAHFEPQGDMVEQMANDPKTNPGLGKYVQPSNPANKYLKKPIKGMKVGTTSGKGISYSMGSANPDEVYEEKDACYKKVKARYDVWPSAYASGALVKCRKVGAANWGNKTKKESFSNWREEILFEGWEDKLRKMTPEQISDLKKSNPGAAEKIDNMMKQMRSATPRPQGSGSQLPNVTRQQAQRPTTGATWDKGQNFTDPRAQRVYDSMRKPTVNYAQEKAAAQASKTAAQARRSVPRGLGGRLLKAIGKNKYGLLATAAAGAAAYGIGKLQNSFSRAPKNESVTIENSDGNTFAEVIDIIGPAQMQVLTNQQEVWTGTTQLSNWREELEEDWQKVNKSDKTDGMSQKAVNAYRRENPGSKLKTAVTEKDPGPGRSKRRKSFCARSKGQQDMHNIDCSKDPDKAICKARRRWRC